LNREENPPTNWSLSFRQKKIPSIPPLALSAPSVAGVEYAGDETARECGEHCDEKCYFHQLVKRSGRRFTYGYDFGDRWMHDIVVEKTNPCPGEPPPARCLAFLHDRSNAKPDRLELCAEPAWVLAFEPECLDLDEINRRLT